MTRDNAAQYLPIINAWIAGKQMQSRDGVNADKWYDFVPNSDVSFRKPPECYRVKPELKLRAWKPEEIELGTEVRPKDRPKDRIMLMGVDGNYVYGHNLDSKTTFLRLFENYTLADGKPCGVTEDGQ